MSRADDIIEGLRREAASRAARSHGHGAGERDRDLGSLLQTGRQLADSMSGHEVPKSTDEGRAFHSSREGLAGREGRAYRTSSYEEERVPPRQARYSRSNRPVRPEEKPVRQASRPQPSRASREAFKRASFLASQRLMRGVFDPFGDDPEPWDPSFVPVPPPESEPPVPEPITHMRAMAHGSSDQGWSYGGSKLFFEQALLMADYTDDLPYKGRFTSYYPTYQDMSNRVLRGYFTWRTLFRQGQTPLCPASFLFVHAYEVLCGVGVEPGPAGLRELNRMYKAYHDLPGFESLSRYLPRWMRDYVVYHGIDPADLPADSVSLGERAPFLGAVAILRRAEGHLLNQPAGTRWREAPSIPNSEELVRALDAASRYHLSKSKAMKVHPQELTAIIPQVFARMVDHCRRRRKVGFVDGLFGPEVSVSYLMYSAAVFWEASPHADARVKLPTGEVYTCTDGRWRVQRVCEAHAPSKELGQILKAVDRIFRTHVDDLPPLKEAKTPKYLAKIIEEEVQGYLDQRAAHEAAQVHIDRTKLRGIREAAGRTQEALLVDEEREEVPVVSEPDLPVLAEAVPAEAASRQAGHTTDPNPSRPCDQSGDDEGELPSDASPDGRSSSEQLSLAAEMQAVVPTDGLPSGSESVGLSPLEASVLRDLLDERPADAESAARAADMMLSLVVDTINEKLLDLVGDTVIDYATDTPELIEDYIEDVREVLS